MKKLVLALSIAFAGLTASSVAMAQDQPADSIQQGAIIKMDKEVHDYGTITQGDNGQCKFTIMNEGTEPLIISLCKGSCGCTVPVCPQEPIPPGASAEITVKYNTNRVGPINKSVTITSNAKNEPRKIIRIKGTVKAKPSGSAPVMNGGPTNG